LVANFEQERHVIHPLAPHPFRLPPPSEVRGLWDRCLPVTSDDEVRAWLYSLQIDPFSVASLDLGRALPRTIDTPSWARYGSVTWQSSNYRLLVPLYSAVGQMTALYARSLRPPIWTHSIRSIPPVVGPAGHVMADASALALLRGSGEWPEDSSWRTVIVTGGAADFLEWASATAESAPAVLGIIPGSWTRELAARIPPGSRVIVRAHANPIASRYAHRVQDALGRRCEVIVKTAA
jgi:hypothetical protein